MLRRSCRYALAIVLIALIAGCATAAGAPPTAAPAAQAPGEIVVFAAASLTDAFRQIGSDFEKANPGTKVTFNFGGSQQLAAQIGQGAPADVFASANGAQMTIAVNAGRVSKADPLIFVRNLLVVVISPSAKARINSLQDLAKPGVKIVLAAKAVPVGQYSLDFLDSASKDQAFGSSYKPNVLGNVVSYEDNVRSVLAKVALGEGDAGIVYASDVVASPTTKVQQIAIPLNLNSIASYPIAPISDSKNIELARAFIRYVLSGDARLILIKNGFSQP